MKNSSLIVLNLTSRRVIAAPLIRKRSFCWVEWRFSSLNAANWIDWKAFRTSLMRVVNQDTNILFWQPCWSLISLDFRQRKWAVWRWHIGLYDIVTGSLQLIVRKNNWQTDSDGKTTLVVFFTDWQLPFLDFHLGSICINHCLHYSMCSVIHLCVPGVLLENWVEVSLCEGPDFLYVSSLLKRCHIIISMQIKGLIPSHNEWQPSDTLAQHFLSVSVLGICLVLGWSGAIVEHSAGLKHAAAAVILREHSVWWSQWLERSVLWCRGWNCSLTLVRESI